MNKLIKDSENWLKILFESFPDAVALTDLKGNLIDCNYAALELSGFNSKKEIIGYNALNFVSKEDKQIMKQNIKNLTKKGLIKDIEHIGFNKEGQIIPIEVSSRLIFDESGKPDAILSTVKDISKRKKFEETLKADHDNLEIKINERTKKLEEAYQALSESEENFRQIAETIEEVFWIIDPKMSKVIYISPAYEKIWGRKRQELYENPKSWIDAIHPDDRERSMKMIWGKSSDKIDDVSRGFEYRIIRPDGELLWIWTKAFLIKDKSGDVIRLTGIASDITHHKKVEEDLKDSESYYRTIFENTGTASFIIEENSIISLVNAEYEELSGYSKEEIEGKLKWQEFVSPDDLHKMEEYHNFRIHNPNLAPSSYEFKFIDKYGTTKNVNLAIAVIPRTKKSVVSVLDITDKKMAENALLESKAQLQIAMDLAKLVSWEYDVKSDTFTFDDHFYALYGTTTEKEGGTKMLSEEYAKRFIPPEESHLVGEEIVKALKTDDPNFIENIEHSIIRSDGQKRFINVRFGLIKDEKGQTIRTYGANQDITERKKDEQEIKKRSEKLNILNKIIITANRSGSVKSLLKDVLEQTLNLIPFDGGEIYLIDKKMGIAKVFHSKGTSESFKTLRINEQPHRLIYINGKSAFRNDLDKYSLNISTESDSQSIAIVPIFSEGEIIGSLSLASKEKHYFTDEEKELIKSIGNEIGNVIGKLKAEEEMEKLIEELKRSNEELEQFAYITSHDLQEPLRTIASFTQLLERRYKNQLDSDADEFMDYIVDASIRMKQMIQGLLEYSRIGKGGLEFKPVNLDEVLKEVSSNLKAVIDKNDAEIIWGELPEPIGDSKLLVQLLQNLIGNAIKFRKPDEPPKIHISFLDNKSEYKDVFYVEDNGIGIEPQFSDRIFKVFKRLHTIDQYKGTGIGLATCKRIVEHHGGHIWVESELNKGSRFYFTLKA